MKVFESDIPSINEKVVSREDKFWATAIGNDSDYEQKITSVFSTNNKLTEILERISNKHEKTVIDFGCGIGKAIPFIKGFKKVYAVDFSENMLNQAKDKYSHGNIVFLKGNLKSIKVPRKADVTLSISSIFPHYVNEFDLIIQNLMKNTKAKGTLILSLPSFEALTFLYQINSFNKLRLGQKPSAIRREITLDLKKANYDPLGYIITGTTLTQKYWLKEEILFRLERYNLKKINIEKLELNWETQLKKTALKNYPKFWFWLIEIKI